MHHRRHSDEPFKRLALRGTGLSGGVAAGKAFIYKDILSRDHSDRAIDREEIPREYERIEDAMAHVLHDVATLKGIVKTQLDAQHARIFDVHQAFLYDPGLMRDVKEELEGELLSAEQAIKNVFRKWVLKLQSAESDMIRSKAADLEDVGRRLLRVLLGYEKNILERLPPQSVVVAHKLLPSDTVHLNKKHVSAIVVQEGSSNAHSAILARALGIPLVANPERPVDLITQESDLLVNGDEGMVIIGPDERDHAALAAFVSLFVERERGALERAKTPALTMEGTAVTVYANAAVVDDFQDAVMRGCDGIGLFSIEHIYMSTKNLPDEKYLINKFETILPKADGRKVTVRLLDIGGDKMMPYLNLANETNPFLGLRGIRLLFRHENILRTQLRAFLLLGRQFPLRLLLPLVTFAEEVKRVRILMESSCEELRQELGSAVEPLPLGAMIETPAAVLNAEEIAGAADFLSIGTNDLIQYTMAAGRENPSVADYYERGAGMVLEYIASVLGRARQHERECCVCGEMAGDLDWTPEMVRLGARHLSVAPRRIPFVKEKVRSLP